MYPTGNRKGFLLPADIPRPPEAYSVCERGPAAGTRREGAEGWHTGIEEGTLEAAGQAPPARRAAGTGLILSVVLFLLPLLTVPPPGSEAAAEELPTGTLPIHRAVQTASGERDKSRMVKLQQADGTVAELSMSDYLFGVVGGGDARRL